MKTIKFLKKMIVIKKFPPILLVMIFLTSCKTSINKDYPTISPEENIIKNINPEKKGWKLSFLVEMMVFQNT